MGTTNAYAGKPAPNQTPVVTAFDVATTSASPVPVSTFTATDADGNETITGYLITETPTRPSAGSGGWTLPAPTQYITSTVGMVTLYGWAKDDRDAVSNSLSDSVTIPAPAIDADTLDGIDSTGFATAVHDHDSAYQKKYANIVVVAKSGGDFTEPVSAVNAITGASGFNPYLVKIMPGVYDLGSASYLQMKPYVDIQGSGSNVTIIKGGHGVAVIKGATMYYEPIPAEASDLTVEATSGQPAVYGLHRLNRMAIISSGIGVDTWADGAAQIKDAKITAATGITSGNYATMRIDNVVIDASITGIFLGGDTQSVLNNVEVSSPLPLQVMNHSVPPFDSSTIIHNSSFKITAGGQMGISLSIFSNTKLNNVTVDSAAAGDTVPSVVMACGAVANVFGGQYIGDVTFDASYCSDGGALFNAANAQFTGGIVLPNWKCFNCFDGLFNPIP